MIGLFLAAVSLGLVVYAVQLVREAVEDRLTRDNPAPPARERVFAVSLVTAIEGREVPVLQSFGEIASRRTLELRAAIGGRIISLAPEFEDGGSVRRGMVLVAIDPADMQAMVDRLTADLADARAEVRDAERGLDLARQEEQAAQEQARLREKAFARQKDLAARGVGTSAAVEEAELTASAARAVVLARRQALAQAEARVDQAATRLTRASIALAEAERNLEDTTLEAPFDGTLSDTSVVEGGLIAANERLADLIDPNDLEVSFRVSTAQYARLLDAEGQLVQAPVRVTLDVAGADLVAEGTISRVSAAAGEGQTGRLVFARLTEPFGFRPGDFVAVEVQEPALENVVRLPASSLGANGSVLVLGSEDRLEEVSVELVRRQGDDVLVRGDGLDGREVVRQRSPLLGEGIAVRPLRPEATDASAVPEQLNLSDERRAELMALVQANTSLPDDAKARMLAQLARPQVPAQVVARIESRMGG
jgi:RND family efflux transporter MFP subunit